MLIDRPTTPTLPRSSRRATAMSLLAHGLLALAVIGIVHMPARVLSENVPPSLTRLVFLDMPGPSGGGGAGGGDPVRTPPRSAEVIKTTKPKPIPQPSPVTPEPEPLPVLAAVPSTNTQAPGVIEPSPAAIESRGAGDGPGTAGNNGPGSGAGRGPGIGPGTDGGTGGGAFRAGNGVSSPKLLNAVRPNYTADAMRARISGSVWLECVVEPNGTVDRCRLSRSLDPNLGLDREALKAAQKWTFEPGKRAGEAVPVQVTIELAFSLR